MNPRKIIGNNIQNKRVSKGVKQEVLAKHLGITKGRLSQIENGECAELSVNRLEIIARYLDIDFFELIKPQAVDKNDIAYDTADIIPTLIKALIDELARNRQL